MLNEIKEYEQYTEEISQFSKFKNERLKFFPLIKKNFSGILRALTIIARYHIFNKNNISDNDVDKYVLDSNTEATVKDILRAWCGFISYGNEDNPEVKRLDGWLERYIRGGYCFGKD